MTLLHVVSIAALILGAASAIAIAIDEVRRPQMMAIMNVVWPTVSLFGGLIVLRAYFKWGVLSTKAAMAASPAAARSAPFAVQVGKACLHCGSGCTIGDICAEWLAFAVPTVAVWFGWRSLFSEKMFAVWILDFVFAFAIGVVFQYLTIAPMRRLSLADGLKQAVKADALALTAWQIGMYGFMAVASLMFRRVFDLPFVVNSFEYWFMMQIAMLCGFVTSYPVNWMLVRSG